MNFKNLKTYNSSPESAFEAFCTQLFEQWVKINYASSLVHLQTVNGAGGDGGVESYALFNDGKAIGLQAKWFLTSLADSQINQIKKSIIAAMQVRPHIGRYIVCLPRNPQSDKIGVGGKPIKRTEENRIADIKQFVSKKYPGLELDIWYESRLREELQRPGNEGIAKYWFEREVISIKNLQNRFELSVNGWLKERYIPSLHSQGEIHNIIEELLFTPDFREKEITKVRSFERQCSEILQLIDEIKSLIVTGHPISAALDQLRSGVNICNALTSQLKTHLGNGIFDLKFQPPDLSFVNDVMDGLHMTPLPVTCKNIQLRLLYHLENFKDEFEFSFLLVVDSCKRHNYVVLGGPGSGKTHGAADAVKLRLTNNLPAVIIQAKSASAKSWEAILNDGIGGMKGWTENEVFHAIEAVAVMADIRRVAAAKEGEILPEPTRVLIAVDGLDESSELENWRNRINELSILSKRFPRMHFVFTVRSTENEFDEPKEWQFDQPCIETYILPQEGDVSVNTLVPLYFSTYDIKFQNVPWIVEMFENALSLKLFCDRYAGEDLNEITSPIVTSLRDLLNAKITKLEIEFFERHQPNWSIAEQIIRKCLIAIPKIFNIEGALTHDEMLDQLLQSNKGPLDRGWAGKILDALCDYGILRREGIDPEDGLSPVVYVYYVTYQSYLDFFNAINATNEIVKLGSKMVPAVLHYTGSENALRLTATALLIDHDILVGENGYWTQQIDPIPLLSIQINAFNAASKATIEKYLPVLKRLFFASTEHRNMIFERFVLRNISRPDLSLGLTFLHQLLDAFPSAFARDLVWSGPDYGNKDHRGRVKRIGEFLYVHNIEDYQRYDGMPLVFAWSFSGTDRANREFVRHWLTLWACQKIGEFVKLLNLVFFCNDPQISEDLAIVMAGVGNLVREPGKGLNLLVDWVSKNIFAIGKIDTQRDAIIRHCCRTVIEKAYRLGECTEEEHTRALPPYAFVEELLPIDLEKPIDKHNGRFPIVHDLAWYVIKDAYEKFSFYAGDNKKRGALLLQYEAAFNTKLTPFKISVGAAIAFFKQLGWNRPNSPSTTAASHGSKSQVYTLEEKYTWLAVHMLMGYYADRVPFGDFTNLQMVADYSQLTQIPNSVHFKKKVKDYYSLPIDNWFVPEDIAPQLNFGLATKWNDVKAWVRRSQTPDFAKWLYQTEKFNKRGGVAKPKWVTLYLKSDLGEPNGIGRSVLEFICCAVEKSKLAGFIEGLKGMDKRQLHDISDLEHFMAEPMTDSYISIQEIIDRQSLKEEYSIKRVTAGNAVYDVVKTTVKGIDENADGSEVHYRLPSKLVRSLLNIDHISGNFLLSQDNSVAGAINTIGEPYLDKQEFVYVDAARFKKGFQEKKLASFWIAFSFQNTTLRVRAEEGYTHHQYCKIWLVWEVKGRMQSCLIYEGTHR